MSKNSVTTGYKSCCFTMNDTCDNGCKVCSYKYDKDTEKYDRECYHINVSCDRLIQHNIIDNPVVTKKRVCDHDRY